MKIEVTLEEINNIKNKAEKAYKKDDIYTAYGNLYGFLMVLETRINIQEKENG